MTRLNGDYLYISLGRYILTRELTLKGERAFEFTIEAKHLENVAEAERDYLAKHPEIMAGKPAWAETVEVDLELDGSALVVYQADFGVVQLSIHASCDDGQVTFPDGVSAYAYYSKEEAEATPESLREVASQFCAAATALEGTPAEFVPTEWVNDTVAAEQDGHIIRAVTHQVGIFETQVEHAQLLTSSGFKDFGMDATVAWNSTDVDGMSELEEFSIKLHDIPGLIAALQLAQAVAK